MVTSWPPVRLLRCVCAGRGCGGAWPFLPRRDEGNVCACVCTCVCARGVLFNVYISTIYTQRSWGPYIYSIPCLGSVSRKGQNDFQVGQSHLTGDSDARVQRGKQGHPWQAPPSRLGPILYMVQSPVQQLPGCSGRGNGQAAASPEPTRVAVLHRQSHPIQNPKDVLGFAESEPSLRTICLQAAFGSGMRPSGSRCPQGCSGVACASPHRAAPRGDITGS